MTRTKKPKKLTALKKKEFIKDEKKAVKIYKKYGKPIKAIAKDEASLAQIISKIKTKHTMQCIYALKQTLNSKQIFLLVIAEHSEI